MLSARPGPGVAGLEELVPVFERESVPAMELARRWRSREDDREPGKSGLSAAGFSVSLRAGMVLLTEASVLSVVVLSASGRPLLLDSATELASSLAFSLPFFEARESGDVEQFQRLYGHVSNTHHY